MTLQPSRVHHSNIQQCSGAKQQEVYIPTKSQYDRPRRDETGHFGIIKPARLPPMAPVGDRNKLYQSAVDSGCLRLGDHIVTNQVSTDGGLNPKTLQRKRQKAAKKAAAVAAAATADLRTPPSTYDQENVDPFSASTLRASLNQRVSLHTSRGHSAFASEPHVPKMMREPSVTATDLPINSSSTTSPFTSHTPPSELLSRNETPTRQFLRRPNLRYDKGRPVSITPAEEDELLEMGIPPARPKWLKSSNSFSSLGFRSDLGPGGGRGPYKAGCMSHASAVDVDELKRRRERKALAKATKETVEMVLQRSVKTQTIEQAILPPFGELRSENIGQDEQLRKERLKSLAALERSADISLTTFPNSILESKEETEGEDDDFDDLINWDAASSGLSDSDLDDISLGQSLESPVMKEQKSQLIRPAKSMSSLRVVQNTGHLPISSQPTVHLQTCRLSQSSMFQSMDPEYQLMLQLTHKGVPPTMIPRSRREKSTEERHRHTLIKKLSSVQLRDSIQTDAAKLAPPPTKPSTGILQMVRKSFENLRSVGSSWSTKPAALPPPAPPLPPGARERILKARMQSIHNGPHDTLSRQHSSPPVSLAPNTERTRPPLRTAYSSGPVGIRKGDSALRLRAIAHSHLGSEVIERVEEDMTEFEDEMRPSRQSVFSNPHRSLPIVSPHSTASATTNNNDDFTPSKTSQDTDMMTLDWHLEAQSPTDYYNNELSENRFISFHRLIIPPPTATSTTTPVSSPSFHSAFSHRHYVAH